MLKHTLTLILASILVLSCAKPYDYINGDPKLDFTGTKRTARVGKPYRMHVQLLGQLPHPDDFIELVVRTSLDAFMDYRLRGVGKLGNCRIIPGPEQTINLVFTTMDYYDAIGRITTDNFGKPRLIRPMDPNINTNEYGDELEGNVTITVEIWIVEPHPTVPGSWVRINKHTRRAFQVRLTCPQCPM